MATRGAEPTSGAATMRGVAAARRELASGQGSRSPGGTLLTAFLLALLAGAPAPGLAAVQDRGSGTLTLERDFPEMSALLERVEVGHWELYRRLAANETDDDMYRELVDLLQSGASAGEVAPFSLDSAPLTRLHEIARRTHLLHRRILDLYADREVADPVTAAEAAIDDYLSDPEHSLPAEPKDMGLMHEHPRAMAFRGGHPRLSGLIWASHWLQLAAYDPLFQRTAQEERADGMRTVIERFTRKLDDPPTGFPTEMPMAPTIAPSLLHWHPRAAAILDNLNMMHEVVADLLVHPHVEDRSAAIELLISEFVDPGYRMVDRTSWLLMSLRHGIFNQGGPALGTLERSERNLEHGGHHHHGGQMIVPGMPR